MRILWFTNTPSLYEATTHHYFGGGWIESLEILLRDHEEIKLGICFFHPTDGVKKVSNNTSYYPIFNKKSGVSKLMQNWGLFDDAEENTSSFLARVEDFKPDVIHIFGLEGPFASIQKRTKIPVIIHLQGLINPYINAYLPPGFSRWNVAYHSFNLFSFLKGSGFRRNLERFKEKGTREIDHLNHAQFVMGRTEWDKQFVQLLAPSVTYFHVDEILRAQFYEASSWIGDDSSKIIIATTISPTIYKGLDLVYKTAQLLTSLKRFQFEWYIFGLAETNETVDLFERLLDLSHKNLSIRYLGSQKPEQLLQRLVHADVFVHPSYIDNSPNSVCEAQMVGIPVIACDVGGVGSLIEHNVSGILVPSNAPYELAYQIQRVGNDKALAFRLGKKAKEVATLRHNKQTIVKDLLRIYQTLKLS